MVLNSGKSKRNKQEILDILKSYFYNRNTFQTIDGFSLEDEHQLFDFCESDEMYLDSNTALPDGILVLKDKLIIAEHFEIDASRKTEKGSIYRKNEAQKKPIDCSIFKLENLIWNFVKGCNKHYEQIERYKKAINEKLGMDANRWPIWFFVEDITPYGSDFTTSDMSRIFYSLLKCLKPNTDVDFLFYFMRFNGEPVRFVVSKRQIKLFNERKIDNERP